MGLITSFHTALTLQKKYDIKPVALFVSGTFAPNVCIFSKDSCIVRMSLAYCATQPVSCVIPTYFFIYVIGANNFLAMEALTNHECRITYSFY